MAAPIIFSCTSAVRCMARTLMYSVAISLQSYLKNAAYVTVGKQSKRNRKRHINQPLPRRILWRANTITRSKTFAIYNDKGESLLLLIWSGWPTFQLAPRLTQPLIEQTLKNSLLYWFQHLLATISTSIQAQEHVSPHGWWECAFLRAKDFNGGNCQTTKELSQPLSALALSQMALPWLNIVPHCPGRF